MLTNILLLCLAFISSVSAIPTWQGFTQRSSIASLVSGATPLHAVGLPFGRKGYLNVSSPPGVPGNVTIEWTTSPPLFFVDRGQLYQYTNESYVLRVNVLNSTASEEDPMPYKLVVGDTREGLSDAYWKWRGEQLHFDHRGKTNEALFYSCWNSAGQRGAYLFLETNITPPGCAKATLQATFNGDSLERKQERLIAK